MTTSPSGLRPACSRCPREAEVVAVGRFRNGRPARDPRCRTDKPTAEDVGCWLLFGVSDRMEFILDRVEVIPAT